MAYRARLLAIACLACGALSAPARAVSVSAPDIFKNAPTVSQVNSKKEFYVNYPSGMGSWKDLEVFLVVRQKDDPIRKGWHDFEFVGRSVVAESSSESAHMVLYKPFRGGEMQVGDHLVKTGDPLTLDEMELLRKEVLGVLQRDKELEDLFTGLISLKLGLYKARLDTTSIAADGTAGDTNAFKKADGFFLNNLGLRWWFFFNPALGLNVDYATGSILTKDFKREEKTSSQTYINPGLMYRGRFLIVPTVYSLTYFINSFNTTNADDFLISSTYSGPNLGVTFYLPYRTELLRLGKFAFVFNNAELGGGIAPSVNVSDTGAFKRGTSASGRQLSANAGLEFGLVYRSWHWTNDLFFVFEYGLQRYDLTFSGATSGLIEGRTPIPEGGRNVETQSWYGVRIKYNFRDFVGELLNGM